MAPLVISISKGRDRLMKLANSAQEAFDRYILTNDVAAQAVLMGYDEFEGWLETLEICQSKRGVREIKRAERMADRRKTRFFEEVLGKPRR
jgi:PHD/YefM family antitoxin component YafN of YafNO toxin-antitoxin module